MTYLSAFCHDSNEILTALPMFRVGQHRETSGKTVRRLGVLEISSRLEMKYISARTHDSKEIPTAIPMFSGSGYMIRLLRGLPDVWNCKKSKMAACDRK